MDEVPRRIYVLAVVTAVAAGAYVAYRLGLRARQQQRLDWDAAPTFAPDALRVSPEDTWGYDPRRGTERAFDAPAAVAREAPTGEAATVVATMEAPSPTPSARPYAGNGSALAAPANDTTSAPRHEPIAQSAALPRRRGLSGGTLAGIATVIGLAAIALGAWAVVLGVNDEQNGVAPSAVELEGVQQVVSLLSRPSTERIPLQGSAGRIILVVGARGYGVLVLDGLAPAPAGKSYQAWVIRPDAEAPQSAAVFSGSDVVVPLTTSVPPGAAVAITLERAGGAPAPTQTPKLVAKRTT